MTSTRPELEIQPGIGPGYDRIQDARLEDGVLRVRFGNGDDVAVRLDELLAARDRDADVTLLQVSPAAVVIGPQERPVEISWLAIRSATDEAFSEQLIETADEEARQIGARLRQLRVARKMKAKDVAERAGITPMSLSRIETGKHDVVYRTLQRVLTAMGYTLRDLAELEPPPLETKEIMQRVADAGVSKKVIDRIVLGDWDQPQQVLARIKRIFRWSEKQIAGDGPLRANPAAAFGARFKATSSQDPAHETYVMWANYLALLVDQASPRQEVEIPENPLAIRQDLLAQFGGARFEHLLRWCWTHDIAVLPLDDPGEFHGACWSFSGRAVIVLKQLTPWESRWTFDLAHELGHVARHLDGVADGIVEPSEITPIGDADGDEQEASDFAGEILLGQPDALAKALAQRTSGWLPRLKAEVRTLAEAEHVEVDALANYMAYRLDSEGENWWGTAAKLQDESGDAQRLARRQLLDRLDFDLLAPDDRAILSAALKGEADG